MKFHAGPATHVSGVAWLFLMLAFTRSGYGKNGASAATTAKDVVVAQCRALEGSDFAAVPEAPTQILSADIIAATETAPSHCRVSGYVSPQVGFELALPIQDWNGKFIHFGSGGHAGAWGSQICFPSLSRGYACLLSDMGHKGTGTDGLWALNNLQAEIDWGFRATHVVTLAGKAIAQAFYGRAPTHAYFSGCSTGGRQALQEAQRFPWDFDGIIAGAPPVDLSSVYLMFAWGVRAMHDATGVALLGEGELKLLRTAAQAKCDLDDGVKDGIIGDPLHCGFDPRQLACKGGQTESCLTPAQIQAAQKVYAGPTTSRGLRLTPGGAPVGSEYDSSGHDWREIYTAGKDSLAEKLMTNGLRDLFFFPQLPFAWKLSDFDFDRDPDRLRLMQSIYDSGNPDLRKFKAAGGKLLAYHGLKDFGVMAQATIDYYETVERTLGGRAATQDFFRLFLLPGIGHCAGGDGADTVDYLTALEDWVERGKAPDRLVAAHMKNGSPSDADQFPLDRVAIQFTRPVYPYPIRAHYSGHGDPNEAVNFGPTNP